MDRTFVPLGLVPQLLDLFLFPGPWQAATMSLMAIHIKTQCVVFNKLFRPQCYSFSSRKGHPVISLYTRWPFDVFIICRLWENSLPSLVLYSTIGLFICAALIRRFIRAFSPQLRFIWHCFIRPFSTEDQKTRLEEVCLTHSNTSLIIVLTTLSSSTVDRRRCMTQRAMYSFVAVILCWVFQLPTCASSEKLLLKNDLSGSISAEERVSLSMNLILPADFVSRPQYRNDEQILPHCFFRCHLRRWPLRTVA